VLLAPSCRLPTTPMLQCATQKKKGGSVNLHLQTAWAFITTALTLSSVPACLSDWRFQALAYMSKLGGKVYTVSITSHCNNFVFIC
jgi:hypothetical protein